MRVFQNVGLLGTAINIEEEYIYTYIHTGSLRALMIWGRRGVPITHCLKVILTNSQIDPMVKDSKTSTNMENQMDKKVEH